MIHINEIRLEGNDRFTNQFNLCSDLFQQWQKTEEDSEKEKEAFQRWQDERLKLELGMY
jgi:hypothetical protein